MNSVKSMSDKFRVKLRVMAAGDQQLVMRAAFDDFSVLEHENLVGVTHGGKPVGDDEAGPPLE